MTDLRMVGATPPTPYRTGKVDRKRGDGTLAFFIGFCSTFDDWVTGGDRRRTGNPPVRRR